MGAAVKARRAADGRRARHQTTAAPVEWLVALVQGGTTAQAGHRAAAASGTVASRSTVIARPELPPRRRRQHSMRDSSRARSPIRSLPPPVGLLRGLAPPVSGKQVSWRRESLCRPRTDQLVRRRLGGRRRQMRPTSSRGPVLRTRRTAASRSSACTPESEAKVSSTFRSRDQGGVRWTGHVCSVRVHKGEMSASARNGRKRTNMGTRSAGAGEVRPGAQAHWVLRRYKPELNQRK